MPLYRVGREDVTYFTQQPTEKCHVLAPHSNIISLQEETERADKHGKQKERVEMKKITTIIQRHNSGLNREFLYQHEN
jgi:hypothetical protein